MPYDTEAAAKQLFDNALFADLANELERRLKDDEADMRAVFKLATLAAYHGDAEKASRYYAIVSEQEWRGGVSDNNLAVTFIRAGLTLAGIEKLLAVAITSDPPPAVAFNLAVILDRVADFGADLPPPPQLIGCGLLQPEEKPRAKALEYYKKALAGSAWDAGLDGALYLAPEDIPPSTGFSVTLTHPRIEEAHGLLHQAIQSAKHGQWRLTLQQLDQAVAAHPPLGNAVYSVKTAALIGLCRQLRAEVKDHIERSAFDVARERVEELTALYSEIPADDLVRQLLLAEIAEVGKRLLQRNAAADFLSLQRLSTAAEKALGRLRATRSAAPDAGQQQPAASGGAEQLLHALCGNAIDEQLRRLIQAARYEEANSLLEWATRQWFAKALQLTWQRDINEAKALDCLARAKAALDKRQSEDAQRELASALYAAQQADAKALAQYIEGELVRLQAAQAPDPNLEALQTALAQGQYAEVLTGCDETLKDNPAHEALLALRATALKRLSETIHAWARLEHWDQIDQALDIYLLRRPEDEQAQALRARARQGRLQQTVEQAWDAWHKGELNEAKKLCADALGREPRQPRALALRLEIETAEQHARDAKNGADAATRYQTIYLELQAALSNADAEGAFEKARELRQLDPSAPSTEAACREVFGRYVQALRVMLEASRTAETAQTLEEKLRRLLDIEPAFTPALDLLVQLQRDEVKRNAARMQACRDKLAEAESALNTLNPQAALSALATVFELGIAELAPKAEALREEALRMARQKLTHLLAEGQDVVAGEAEALFKLISRCSPEMHSEILALIERYREQPEAEPQVAKEVGTLIAQTVNARGQPLRALLALDRAVRDLTLHYPLIPDTERARLRTLRERFLKTVSWRQRWSYRVLARLGGVDSLYDARA